MIYVLSVNTFRRIRDSWLVSRNSKEDANLLFPASVFSEHLMVLPGPPLHMQPPASATKNSLGVTNIDYMEIFINLNSSIGKSGNILILLHVTTHVVYSKLSHLTIHCRTKRKCRKSSYGTVTGRSWYNPLGAAGHALRTVYNFEFYPISILVTFSYILQGIYVCLRVFGSSSRDVGKLRCAT